MKLSKSSVSIFFSIGLMVTGVASAADDCKNPQTQMAMNVCSAQDYEREDSKLNKNYKALIAKLETKDKEKLKNIQLAWIKFRDLQCDYEASRYEGGSIMPLISSSCLFQMTKQRNKDLKSMLDDASL